MVRQIRRFAGVQEFFELAIHGRRNFGKNHGEAQRFFARVQDQLEKAITMPENFKGSCAGADRAAGESLESPASRVVFEDSRDQIDRFQWAKAPTPGSVGSAMPGGYWLPEVNSLSACTLMSDDMVSFDAAS